MAPPMMVRFAAVAVGPWRIERLEPVIGEGLEAAPHLTVLEGNAGFSPAPIWSLAGFTSNERYVERGERTLLTARQQALGRAEATCGALIPIRKSGAWWDLTQDERREILEQRSRHIQTGFEYLPAVARRLHHSRDLGEPFDFLTWFEYSPSDATAFEELVSRLRATEEWSFVDREVDVRLVRAQTSERS